MAGIFQTLELGKRALMTQQINLQTMSHNVANVNTPGFTRQRVTITSTYPEQSSVGAIGSGVQVTDIRRLRDYFLGEQYREESKSLGQWSYKEKTISQIESHFGEPYDNALGDQLNEFWQAWDDLSSDPNQTNRNTVLERAGLLVNQLNNLSDQLTNLQNSVDRDMQGVVDEINRLSGDIARINQQVKRAELGSSKANDLRDVRDRLLDEMAEIADVNTREDQYGNMMVYIGGLLLVDGDREMPIATEVVSTDRSVMHNLVWEGTTVQLQNLDGSLKGLMDVRDEVIPSYLEKLDTIAQTLVEQVNAIHRTGVGEDGTTTGVNFFDPRYTDAATIRVSVEIENDSTRIMAGTTGEPGDGTVAAAIRDLNEAQVLENGSQTINGYYQGLVGSLAVDSSEAQSYVESYEILVNQIENSRQSVEGVSLDEEMTNMIKFQQAYEAAARVITAMDQALDTLINGMGVVGR